MSYAQYAYVSPYSSSPCSHFEPPKYSQIPVDDQLNVKVQLRSRLNNATLLNMPGGFPFHHTYTGHGSVRTSYDSYEFKEEFRTSISNESLRSLCVTISFTSPSPTASKPGTRYKEGKYLTWRAYIPALDIRTYSHREPRTSPSPHSQLDFFELE
jgi:hypothetical protein